MHNPDNGTIVFMTVEDLVELTLPTNVGSLGQTEVVVCVPFFDNRCIVPSLTKCLHKDVNHNNAECQLSVLCQLSSLVV